ncbi:MAG: DUF447 domain-containing protein [Chromatiales bacterium]
MIYETVLVTRSAGGGFHIAPMGIRHQEGRVVLAPFRPSATLDNLVATGEVVINMTDDVAVIAGCLTGRRDWPLVPVQHIQGARLASTLAHAEARVERVEEDELRPRFFCKIVHEETHAPFRGFNRAQGAVLEAAILVSRLHMLPMEKIDREVEYLKIAIDKTAGDRERMAWGWLMERIEAHRRATSINSESLA